MDVTSLLRQRHRDPCCLSTSVCVACSDHGVLCIQLDKKRVYHDSFVIDTTGHHRQSPGILPLVSLNKPKV